MPNVPNNVTSGFFYLTSLSGNVASFNFPATLAVTPSGDIYVTDYALNTASLIRACVPDRAAIAFLRRAASLRATLLRRLAPR